MTDAKRCLAASAVLGVLASGQAWAQAEGSPPVSTDSDIVVTAQRRAETTQTVPIAITALSVEQIKASGINGIQDISIATPSFVPGTQVAYGQPYIRGVGSTLASLGTESSVALYVDGIYQSRNLALLSDLSNIERVEILAGPQGALYGRNATGGAVNIVTRTPEAGFQASGDIGYGNYDAVNANLYVNGGNDVIAANVAGTVRRHGGYTINLATGHRVEKARNYAVSGKIRVNLGDRTSVILAGDYLKSGPDMGTYIVPIQNNPSNFYASILPGANYSFKPRRIYTDEEDRLHNRVSSHGLSARLKNEFDGFDLNLIGSYRYLRGTSSVDADGSDAHLFFFDTRSDITHDYNAEANIVSTGSSPLSWIAGINYFQTKGSATTFVDIPYQGINTVLPGKVNTKALALFGQAGYKFGADDQWDFTAGLRFTTERKAVSGETFVYLESDPTTPIFSASAAQSKRWRNVSGNATLTYAFNKDMRLYAKYSRGFKSGSFNVVSPADPAVNPETIDSYELGFKSDLLDRRLRFNLTGFFYNYKNIQLLKTTAAGNSNINAASSHIYGLEAEIVGRPSRALTLRTAATYLNAKYKNFENAGVNIPGVLNGIPGNYPAESLGLPNPDLSGTRMVRAPKFSGTASAQYRFAGPLGDWELFGIARYTSKQTFTQPARLNQSSYVVANASITLRPREDLFVRAWVNNLTNKNYITAVSVLPLGDAASYADPRTYGATVGFNF